MARFLLGLLLCLSAPAAQYEVLIRNARIADGTGNPWFHGDVGIIGDRIAAVGRLTGASGYRTIDANGRVLAPGFIDVHTHVEGGIQQVPHADNYVLDGVTTIITGNCGGSRVDLGRWFSELESSGIGINLGSLIGHNSVRGEIMGRANRQPDAAELARMQALVEQAMREGAVGFFTGLIYIPGTYAKTDEVVALAKAAAKHGGVYASHMRDEGVAVLAAIEEAVTVGKEAGMPVQLSHFKIDNKKLWGSSDKTLALVEKYRREGVDVVVDQYPYDRSSTNLGIRLPRWALADGQSKILERLRDPATRARIKLEMAEIVRALGHENYEFAMVAAFEPNRAYEGKTISQINESKDRPKTLEAEIDTILDLMEQGGAQMVYHSMGNEDVERILRYPNTAIASDGGVREFGIGMPHPRSYGTNARVLAEFVRQRNVLSLEDAIRRMTSLPARTFGLADKGQVKAGYAADLVLFDPGRVHDRATFENPHQFSEGFDFVFVNGTAVVDNGNMNNRLPGRIVRPLR